MTKPDFTALAQRLASNPNYIAEEEEATLRELLAIHSVGMLESDMIEEMEQMIETSPLAASIWREFQASEENLKTKDGQAWLEKSHQEFMAKIRVTRATRSDKETANTSTHEPLSDPFASWRDLGNLISELFVSRASLATASGRDGMKRTTEDGETRILLKSDSAGRQWLYVTSTKREFAGRSFQVEVEPAQARLSFSEATPGVYEAHVRVSDELAAALSSGAELKLTPVPLS